MGRFRPAIRHALWLVVLVKLMTPPVLTWPAPAPESLPAAALVYYENIQAQAPLPPAPSVARAETSIPPPAVSAPSIWRHTPALLLGVWLAGAMCALGLHITRIRRFLSLMRHAQPAPAWLCQRAEELAKMFGVRKPTVMAIPGLTSALVWNPWRPRIFVSPDLLQTLQPRDWDGIIAHELAHLKRHDLWTGWLELATACVWWWNPLTLLIRRRLRLNAEFACDAWVLWALPENGARYADVLFRIASTATRRQRLEPASAMASGDAAAFKARLTAVLRGGGACGLPWWALAAVVALLLVAAPGAPTLGGIVKAAEETTVNGNMEVLQGPETTEGAEAIVELKIYISKNKTEGIKGSIGDSALGLVEDSDLTLTLCGIDSEPSFIWEDNEESRILACVHVASPVIAQHTNTSTYLSIDIPEEVREWLHSDTPLRFLLSDLNTPERNSYSMRLLPLDSAKAKVKNIDTNVWFANDSWERTESAILNKEGECFSLLVYGRKLPCDPSQPPRELPGPEHGEYVIKRIPRKTPFTGIGMACRTQAYLIEADTTIITTLFATLPSLEGGVISIPGSECRRFPNAELIYPTLEKIEPKNEIELLSAPRDRFPIYDYPLMFVNNGRGPITYSPFLDEKDPGEWCALFSESLGEYYSEYSPPVIYILNDINTGKVEAPKITSGDMTGHAFAMNITKDAGDGLGKADIFINSRELVSTEKGTDIQETSARITAPCRIGEGFCYTLKSPNPNKTRVFVFALKDRDSMD